MFAGTVSSFRGRLQLVHPEYELLPGAPPNADLTPELAAEFATELIPVYPASAKASSWVIARSVQTVLDPLDAGGGPAPGRGQGAARAVRPGRGHPGHPPAAGLGRPRAGPAPAASGTRRSCCRPRWRSAGWRPRAMPAMPRPHVEGGLADELRRPAAVRPHRGQRRGGRDDRGRPACAYPMHRLLQGEVGSGKTVVAIRAMLQVVDAGGQAALLAPDRGARRSSTTGRSRGMLGPLAQGGQLGGGRARDRRRPC